MIHSCSRLEACVSFIILCAYILPNLVLITSGLCVALFIKLSPSNAHRWSIEIVDGKLDDDILRSDRLFDNDQHGLLFQVFNLIVALPWSTIIRKHALSSMFSHFLSPVALDVRKLSPIKLWNNVNLLARGFLSVSGQFDNEFWPHKNKKITVWHVWSDISSP